MPWSKRQETLEERIVIVRERLATSANGYVVIKRFSHVDKAAVNKLIEAGEAEIFESPLGRAYRLKQKEEKHVAKDHPKTPKRT